LTRSETESRHPNTVTVWALGTAALLLLASFLLWMPPVWEPLALENKPYRAALDVLPVEDILPIKLAHAASHPAYDIGLFGNSRTYPVGTKDVKRPDSLFNFSIGSQSFRNSVRMMAALEEIGKTPKYAVLQFNHSEITFDNEAPLYPRSAAFVTERIEEARILVSQRQSLKSIVLHLYNIGYHELDREASGLNARYLASRVRLHLVPAYKRLNGLLGTRFGQARISRYGEDGSREPLFHLDTADPDSYRYVRGLRNSDYPLMETDFRALRDVATLTGAKILIYETPIFPALAGKIEANLSKNARDVRARMFQLCEQMKFRCVRAPSFPHSIEHPWADGDHPPASYLGEFLSAELDEMIADGQ